MEPKDIFTTINKVRDNPNIVINEIKDQLKRYDSSHLDFSPILFLEQRKMQKSELFQVSQHGKKPYLQ